VLHPDFLLDALDAQQLTEWEAYEVLEPFGEERGDRRSAQICQVLANVNRDSRNTPVFEIDDFMFHDLDRGKDPEESEQQSPEEMKQVLMGVRNRKKEKRK